jgi:uncharacterized protein
MGTENKTDQLGITLFGKTRRSVLALLYGHVDESFYLRQLDQFRKKRNLGLYEIATPSF